MGVTSSESVQRLQKLLETVDEKKRALITATSDYNRLKIQLEASLKKAEKDHAAAEDSLDQARRQLEVELMKFDPTLFIQKEGEPCLKKS